MTHDPLAEAYNRKNDPVIARKVLTFRQALFLLVLLIAHGLILWIGFHREDYPDLFLPEWADWLLVADGGLILFLMVLPALHRFFVLFRSFNPRDRLFSIRTDRGEEEDLPLYTILVPLYREGNVVHLTLEALKRLDYPIEKLEILLLIETTDDDTRDQLPNDLPDPFRVVDVPPLPPQSKPRALNHGLAEAQGEYLVVYDAECVPYQDQLRIALAAHREHGDEVWAVQAKLRYDNPQDTWLSLLFCAEIAYWFDYYLPYLSQLDYPIPLAGSSNHFRTDRLREIGGWDAYNVTEDADMTFRIYARGGKVALLDSETLQRSPTRARTWFKQRTRWVKGFIQTLLVHLREPVSFKTLRYFVLCMSGSFLVVLSFLYLSVILASIPGPYNLPLIRAGFVAYGISFLAQLVMCFSSLKKYDHLSLSGLTILRRFLFPGVFVYWFLYLGANLRALYQLVFKPFYWDKTDHSKKA